MKKLILTLFLCLMTFPVFAADKESAFERVLRTGTLRCAYGIGAPLISVDPNSGALSGIMVDVMEDLGKALSLKIEWAEEVGWGDLATVLQSGRADAICSTMWASGGRGRSIAYTRPVFFSKIDAFVREGDTRFDEDPAAINHSDIKIAVQDSDVSEEIADADFPLAQKISKPQMSAEGVFFLELTENKADIVFTHVSYARDYMLKNPGKIRRVPLEEPLRLYDNVLGVEIHEQELRDMLNAGLGELINAGRVEKIWAGYEKDYPDMLLMLARPYEMR